MEKKYIVRLSGEERSVLCNVVKKLKGTSQKVRRAQVLLKADADGSNWTDKKISEAFDSPWIPAFAGMTVLSYCQHLRFNPSFSSS